MSKNENVKVTDVKVEEPESVNQAPEQPEKVDEQTNGVENPPAGPKKGFVKTIADGAKAVGGKIKDGCEKVHLKDKAIGFAAGVVTVGAVIFGLANAKANEIIEDEESSGDSDEEAVADTTAEEV